MNKNVNHWANGLQYKHSLSAKIRLHMEESNISGWEMIAERKDGRLMPYKIMKFDGLVSYLNVNYQVLILEVWYSDEGAVYQVDQLFFDIQEV